MDKTTHEQISIVDYPCPNCGVYNSPEWHSTDGYAYCLCETCKVQYKINTRVSINFRKFCSKIASKPNKSPHYYTKEERKVKKIFDNLGFIEGIDYYHNVRCYNPKSKTYYYPDFILPNYKLVIECSPSIWHEMWNRKESENRKREYFKEYGYKYVTLKENVLRNKKLLRLMLENIFVKVFKSQEVKHESKCQGYFKET